MKKLITIAQYKFLLLKVNWLIKSLISNQKEFKRLYVNDYSKHSGLQRMVLQNHFDEMLKLYIQSRTDVHTALRNRRTIKNELKTLKLK